MLCHTLPSRCASSAAAALKKSLHPSGVELVFDPKWHSYKFAGRRLISVSAVLNKFFPFDADMVAARVAEKQKCSVEEVKAEWKTSATLGSNTHAKIESLLLGQPMRTVEQLHGAEPAFYDAATIAANTIAANYEPIAIESMVCSRTVAGTIDFIGRNRSTGALCIMDWKTSASAASGFRFSAWDEPCPAPLSHLINTKMTRYAMQCLMYGELIKSQGYLKHWKLGENLPLEYGVILISKSETGGAQVDYHKIEPASILASDHCGESSVESLLKVAMR